jgi:hypothetical protein
MNRYLKIWYFNDTINNYTIKPCNVELYATSMFDSNLQSMQFNHGKLIIFSLQKRTVISKFDLSKETTHSS